MLQETLKERSAFAHQQLEKIVVAKLKSIRSQKDYVELLKQFYTYFNRLEHAIEPFITDEILPDRAERRHSGFLAKDIISLGGTTDDIPVPKVPEINNPVQALGALYVMEGSIMGGPIIVQMLKKYGITTGTSFFSGYGSETPIKWASFMESLNKNIKVSAQQEVIEAAVDTFDRFAFFFNSH